jgi:hypothetical protein
MNFLQFKGRILIEDPNLIIWITDPRPDPHQISLGPWPYLKMNENILSYRNQSALLLCLMAALASVFHPLIVLGATFSLWQSA